MPPSVSIKFERSKTLMWRPATFAYGINHQNESNPFFIEFIDGKNEPV